MNILSIMKDASFFINPIHDWQRRYEALRAILVDRLPNKIVADKYGYTQGYLRLLCHQFRTGKIDFSEPVPEGKYRRHKISAEIRQKIIEWRNSQLSAGDITELLSEDGVEISIRTVERVLAEEGLPKLPRRTRIQLGLTVKKAVIPEKSQIVSKEALDGASYNSASAGIFIFAPFIAKLNFQQIIKSAKLPGSKVIPAMNYFMSFLALKLLGNERYAHVGDRAFDPGIGLFAGLNAIPKCTALSTYAYSLDEIHLTNLQKAFVKQAQKMGLYKGNTVNLDFHTTPHFGDESVLEKHWAGARNKRMKGALTLFAQNADSKLILYTGADIQKAESDDQVLEFLSFWKGIQRGTLPRLIFDSKFTSYANLSILNDQKIKFITLRRRGTRLVEQAEKLTPWKKINVPHAKRKFPNPMVCDSTTTLRGYEGEMRQLIMKSNGHKKPTFLITNDFDSPVQSLVSDYARRWRVESGIAEAVKFFNLNSLSSPILIKVQFDVIMTMVADTLYTMLAQKLRGFESCDAPKINRHFIKGSGQIKHKDGVITVTFPRRAHNPILRSVAWDRLPKKIPWLYDTSLNLRFK